MRNSANLDQAELEVPLLPESSSEEALYSGGVFGVQREEVWIKWLFISHWDMKMVIQKTKRLDNQVK